MAYKQKGCTPVTAKIKKTTKGGMVQQPLLNMGAPVKMKAKSPYKMKGDLNKDGKMSSYEQTRQNAIDKSMASPAKIDGGKYKDLTFKEYRESGLMKPGEEKFYKGSGTKRVKISDLNKLKNKKQKSLEVRKAGEAGRTADDLARKNETGIYAEKPKAKVTGKIGSELRRKQYDKLGWAYDDTIAKKPKAKKVVSKELSNKKAKVADVAKESKIITPNNNAKPLDKKTVKKVVRKTESAERKESRAAKVRQKGIEALESGNKRKALRLKRREERIKKRAAKKRGQAAKAINPDK